MVSFLKNCSTNGVWKTRTKSPHSSGIEPPAACTAARGLRMILAPNNPRASAPWAPPDRNEQAADYCGSEHYVLSAAVGHLLVLSVPAEFEVKRGKWSFAHLPVIPPHFALNPIEKTQARLKLLNKLIKRKDVSGLINACDAGREGELIFNYIAEHAKSGKPVQRLWLQSMTQGAIRDGFARLRG